MLHDWSVLTRTARDAPLALHLHISKTGGTTLRTLGASLLNRTDCNWNLREGQLPGHAQAARNSSCDFISIEAPAVSLPWIWDGVSWPDRGFTVTVLRNPFEQWYSVVRHTISLLSKQERSIPPSELALITPYNAQVELLRAVKTLHLEDGSTLLGQYTACDGRPGYLDDKTVPEGSKCPTFAACVLSVDNDTRIEHFVETGLGAYAFSAYSVANANVTLQVRRRARCKCWLRRWLRASSPARIP